MPTHKDAKAMAKSLRGTLASRKVSLSHSESLEIVARQLGFSDWNTLSAKLPDKEAQLAASLEPAPTATTVAPRESSCSFCGKSQQTVRSLIEGGCSRTRRAPHSCVFICNECVTFCAEINAGTVGHAGTPQDERDGRRV